ncbi:uncharacterized protein MYCGRDRAFT_106469, partial [Zymoseptoria tritici IPO323]
LLPLLSAFTTLQDAPLVFYHHASGRALRPRPGPASKPRSRGQHPPFRPTGKHLRQRSRTRGHDSQLPNNATHQPQRQHRYLPGRHHPHHLHPLDLHLSCHQPGRCERRRSRHGQRPHSGGLYGVEQSQTIESSLRVHVGTWSERLHPHSGHRIRGGFSGSPCCRSTLHQPGGPGNRRGCALVRPVGRKLTPHENDGLGRPRTCDIHDSTHSFLHRPAPGPPREEIRPRKPCILLGIRF